MLSTVINSGFREKEMIMTKLLGFAAAFIIMSSAASAQEQQVYYPPYLTPAPISQGDLAARQNYILMQQEARLQDNYSYRSPNVLYQDLIPRHPGDYRDAYDRGELPNLGGATQKPSRVHFQ